MSSSYNDFSQNGIDISHWQGDIDYTKAASNISFAMIKLGGSDSSSHKPYVDEKFEKNYKGFTKAKVPVGVYWFVGSHFNTIGIGEYEADYVIKTLRDKKLQYPVAVDIETTPKSDKIAVTRATVAFCRRLLRDGFFPIVYASDSSGFNERLVMENLGDLHKWVAKYSSQKPKHATDWKIWQHSSSGSVPGISGRVDLDKCIYNYPSMIKTYGFNNYKGTKNQNEIAKNDVSVAVEVIRGLWGYGNNLKTNLTKAGRIPQNIDFLVSEIKSKNIEIL